MHWTDWAAIALCVVLFATPVLLLLFSLAAIAWAALAGFWQKRQPIETTETPFGTFTKDFRRWSGAIEVGEKAVAIYAKDVNGAPNPDWLRNLPALMEALPRSERIARQSVNRLTENYRLSSISDGPTKTTDFVLGFHYEEAWGLTVFVDFYEGHVAGWRGARWFKKRRA